MREAGAAAARQRRSGHGRREGRRSRPAPTSFAPVRAAPARWRGAGERSGAAREEQEGRRGGGGGEEERGGAKLVGAGSCAAFAEGSAFGKDQPLRRAAGAAEQGISLCGGRGEAARAARSIFDMEFAFGYIGGESIHEEAMLPLAPSGRPRRGYKQ